MRIIGLILNCNAYSRPSTLKPDEPKKYFGRGTEGKDAAKIWEAERLQNLKKPKEAIPRDLPKLTFADLANKYLNSRPLTPKSRAAFLSALNTYVYDLFGDVPVDDLTMANLADLDSAISAAGRTLATRNRYRSYCKTICQWGQDNDLVGNNPFRRFRAEVGKEGRAPNLATDDEITAIYQKAAPHLQWAIEVMCNTGVRPGRSELFAIKMRDVDFERGGIWLLRQKTAGQTNRPRELLPLRPEFLAKIRAMAEAEPERECLIQFRGHGVNTLKTAWREAKKGAEVTRRLRLYDLRHWYATTLLSSGADLKAASELLGHSNPTTTMQTYYHLFDRQKRAALDHLSMPKLSSTQVPGQHPEPSPENAPAEGTPPTALEAQN